jgi:hypothetical protein
MVDSEGKEEEDMIYCSKCAINLLQQNFKVEELKGGMSAVPKKPVIQGSAHLQQYISACPKNLMGSVGSTSRIQ